MATLASLFENNGTGPYSKPVRVRVVVRANEVLKYKGNDGSDKQAPTVAVSDGTSCMKCICYYPTKFCKLTEGQTVVLREVIRKVEDGQQCIVATKTTKILIAASVPVPEEHTAIGRGIIDPPAAATVPISTALRSPVKQRTSICGKIVQLEKSKTVKVKGGGDVAIRRLTMEGVTCTARVTLWRDISTTQASVGDYIKLSDVVINEYKGEVSLSPTSRSNVEKSEVPLEEKRVSVVGVCVSGQNVELLTEEDETYLVPAELLSMALPEIENLELLTVNGPVTIKIKQKGTEVVDVESLTTNLYKRSI